MDYRWFPGATAFRLYDTHGLPPDLQAKWLRSRGYFIDWGDFYLAALAAGWSHKKALATLQGTLADLGLRGKITIRFTEPSGSTISPKEAQLLSPTEA